MKKLLIIFSVLMTMCSSHARVEENITVYENEISISANKNIDLKSYAFTYETNREYLYIPIEDVMPEFGASLGWDTGRNAEICIIDDKTYYIYSEQNEIECDGEIYWCDAPSIIKDGRFYINDDAFMYMTGVRLSNGGNLSPYKMFTVIAESTKVFVNGRENTLESKPYIYMDRLYIPLDSAFLACGYNLGWDSSKNAVICYKDGVYSYIYTLEGKVTSENTDYTFDYAPLYISKTMYISDEMFKVITGFDVLPYGNIRIYKDRDTMEDTTRTDAYRLSGSNVVRGGGVTVVNGFGMELVSATQTEAEKYAGVINAVAESVPDVNVYNILVPTSAEFYAPISMYPNQLSAIQTVYRNLSDKVTPVNVYDSLKDHCGEKIYFSTDHHWTQRGAYYAYKEFIELKGGTIEDLSTFQNIPSYSFVGSFASFAKGTQAGNIMRNSPELLERFIPKYATVGTVFSDCAVTRPQYTVKAVNTSNNSYSCFIGGDAPITVFYTDAPSDESIVIIKESFGNAFATWAMNNYKKVCIVDPRKFNGFGGNYNYFNLASFCNTMNINDVVFINYPVVVSSSGIRNAILSMR